MNTCADCGWYKQDFGYSGNCRNPKNAEVEYVGGGEHTSSQRCLIPPRVQANFGCELHEVFEQATISKVCEVVEQPRPADAKPWETTPWELA